MICAAVVDAPTGHVTLGAYMANGIEQKGIDTLQQCIKKCAAAGLGIPATVRITQSTLCIRKANCLILLIIITCRPVAHHPVQCFDIVR